MRMLEYGDVGDDVRQVQNDIRTSITMSLLTKSRFQGGTGSRPISAWTK